MMGRQWCLDKAKTWFDVACFRERDRKMIRDQGVDVPLRSPALTVIWMTCGMYAAAGLHRFVNVDMERHTVTPHAYQPEDWSDE